MKHYNNNTTIHNHDCPCINVIICCITAHNNINLHYTYNVHNKYRYRVISLLPVLSEKYIYLLFSITEYHHYTIYIINLLKLMYYKIYITQSIDLYLYAFKCQIKTHN